MPVYLLTGHYLGYADGENYVAGIFSSLIMAAHKAFEESHRLHGAWGFLILSYELDNPTPQPEQYLPSYRGETKLDIKMEEHYESDPEQTNQ